MSARRRTPGTLPARFARHLADAHTVSPGDRVLVALSGGLDSLVLLHLLRFSGAGRDLEVRAAHLDHAIRPESRADADWVRGLCGAWGVPLRELRADPPPATEAAGREVRYRFLEAVRAEWGARWTLTAHHADDQAETVLFRIVRGTGPAGLTGIAARRDPAILRPLLPFRRRELEVYAHAAFLTPRVDPTNRDPAFARNRIRHEALPLLESIHPGARESLIRLAAQSAARDEAFGHLLDPILDTIVVREGGGEVVLDREGFLARPPAVQGELVRGVVRRLGPTLTAAGTAAALEFMRKGRSGGRIELAGSILLVRDFDRFRVERTGAEGPAGRTAAVGESAPLVVSARTAGEGVAILSGRAVRLRWRQGGGEAPGEPGAAFRVGDLTFPLRVRGRLPGDRAWSGEGRRRLKKLMGELGIPADRRDTTPLLLDGQDRVLWIAGHWRAPLPEPGEEEDTWTIGVRDEGDPD